MLISWEVFHWLILCPIFSLNFFTRLGGFSPATYLFEIHQVPYKAKMFSVISRFSSLVFFIGLRGFLPGSHPSLQQFLYLAELAFGKEANCNNVTFGAENLWSESHVTITIIQFDFYHNALSSLAPIWGLNFLLDLYSWFFLTLRIWLLTVYATELPRHLYTSRTNISLWYLFANCPFIKAWDWIILGRHLVARSN